MSTLFGFLWNLGPLEVLIVMVVVLLLFGHRLPSVMRSLGRGVVEFKHGLADVSDDLDERDGGSKERPKVEEKS
jgi:sec-independent protein translocase protein TatA